MNDTQRKAKMKQTRKKLTRLGHSIKDAQRLVNENVRFLGTRYVGEVDDELFGYKPPQISLLEARIKLCEPEGCVVRKSWNGRILDWWSKLFKEAT